MRSLILLALAASCAASPPVRRFEPMDKAAITSVIFAQRDAWNRGDLAAYMDGYAKTPDLVFTSGGHVRRGWQDAFDHYKARYGTDPSSMGTLAFEITEVTPVGADGAVVLGTWQLTGLLQPAGGVFSLVLVRRPEGWRIIHDHTSLASP